MTEPESIFDILLCCADGHDFRSQEMQRMCSLVVAAVVRGLDHG